MKTSTLQSLRATNRNTITKLHAHQKGICAAISHLIEVKHGTDRDSEASKDMQESISRRAKELYKCRQSIKRLASYQRAIKTDIFFARTSTRLKRKHGIGQPHPLKTITKAAEPMAVTVAS